MTMDTTRLKKNAPALVAPVAPVAVAPVEAAPLEVKPPEPTPAVVSAPAQPTPPRPTAAPAPAAPQAPQPVGKLDPITEGLLATVRRSSAPLTAVPAVATPGLDEPAGRPVRPSTGQEGPRPVWVGVTLALLGGAAWLFAGVRSRPTAPVSSGVSAPRAPQPPAPPMPAYVPSRNSPLSNPEFAGYVVVGT